MAAYATYLAAAVEGQPASARVVERLYPTQARADARAAAAAGVSARRGAVADSVDVGDLIDPATGAAVAWAAPTAEAKLTADLRLRLHDAWRAFCDSAGRPATARQDWWRRIDGHDRPLRAVDRWAYLQIALGDLLAAGDLGALNTAAKREAAVGRIAAAVSTRGRAMHGVASADRAKRDAWYNANPAAGQRIGTDLFTAAWADRAPDGTLIQLPAAATVAAGLNPDSPTLR